MEELEHQLQALNTREEVYESAFEDRTGETVSYDYYDARDEDLYKALRQATLAGDEGKERQVLESLDERMLQREKQKAADS